MFFLCRSMLHLSKRTAYISHRVCEAAVVSNSLIGNIIRAEFIIIFVSAISTLIVEKSYPTC